VADDLIAGAGAGVSFSAGPLFEHEATVPAKASMVATTARRGPLVVTLQIMGYVHGHGSSALPVRALPQRLTPMAGVRAPDQSQLEQLAKEQAALRRVATLVAEGAPADTLFALVAEQVADVLRVPLVSIVQYEPDGTAAERASFSPRGAIFQVGTRWSLEGTNVVAQVLQSGRPARIDDYTGLTGVIAETSRSVGIRSTVGIPIAVAGHLWGAMVVSSTDPGPLPPNTETHLAEFTALVATAIANTDARDQVQRLVDEQAALRRVATLVAEDVPPSELFDAVAREVGTLLGADFAGMLRFDDDAALSTMAIWAAVGDHPPVPDRWPSEPGDPATMIQQTRKAARVEDWSAVPGPVAAFIHQELGVNSSVGCPIIVEGRLWGALAVHSKQRAPLPPDTESRLAQFSDLVATAIANAEARADVARMAQEQVALHRVATLVAREASRAEVFTAIAQEIGRLLGTEECRMLRYEDDHTAVVLARSGQFGDLMPVGARLSLQDESATARVFRTGRPARIDYGSASGPLAEQVRPSEIRDVVATPILVEGRLWGSMVTGTTRDAPLPPDTESRLAQFTDLMATAIANAEAHARAERLGEEQAALRRVATLVATEAPPADVFAKVTEELAHVLGDVDCSLFRAEGDGTATMVGAWGATLSTGVPVGTRWPVDGTGVIASVLRDGRPGRVGDDSTATGTLAETGRDGLGIRSAVGCPVLVRGRLWGALAAVRYQPEALPPETEARIGRFAELVATAIANADARAEVERLAEEQAALRRVATLVAEGASPNAVLDAVAAEMEALLHADQVALNRFEPGDEIRVLAHRGLDVARTPVGSRLSLEGESVTATVRRTERPARMEDYARAPGAIAELARVTGLRSSVGAPIVVDGRLWGIITASWTGEESPPRDTEARMARFAQLLDTAIANADSREQLTASRARLLTAGDEARRRVVRDLHDGGQQRLVQAIVTLKLAQDALRRSDGNAESLVDEALAQAEQSNMELRELARGLLPAVLTRGGLRAGVESVVSRLDLPVELDVPAERLPPEVEASAYFIVVEALTNVVKHARAGRVEVRVSVEPPTVHVEVRDDGIGGADASGHGLVGLGDRVNALGGRLTIESPAGGGTRVAAALPL
jgi:GAF domain-containing protein